MADQASKVGMGANQAIISFYDNLQVVQLNRYPLMVTFIADADSNTGSTCGEITVDECLDKIADCINWAHSQTKFVITVVENMSCQGNTVGGHFEELHGIIDRVKDKSRIGICLDTCHAFAAGFDLATEEGYKQFVEDFDKIVGLEYLKAMHLNDSKGKLCAIADPRLERNMSALSQHLLGYCAI
nr:hypothetical protein BaRGS_004505 [Batillaria attramentaria]